MKKCIKRISALATAVMLSLFLFLPVASAATTVTVSIPLQLTLTGSSRLTEPTFSFAFTQVTPGAPMPAQTQLSIVGEGTQSFGPIIYDEPNDYVYKLYQLNGNLTGYTYDSRVYTVTVQITSDTIGNLSANVSLNSPATNGKPNVATFFNNYRTNTKIPKTGYGDLWEKLRTCLKP